MNVVCPECKNNVDVARYPDLAVSNVIECDKCGISLLVTNIENGNVDTEIVDEGK